MDYQAIAQEADKLFAFSVQKLDSMLLQGPPRPCFRSKESEKFHRHSLGKMAGHEPAPLTGNDDRTLLNDLSWFIRTVLENLDYRSTPVLPLVCGRPATRTYRPDGNVPWRHPQTE